MNTVTLYQIAEACEVSQPTVSRILNGSTRHSDATRERVLAAADRLGYRVNTAARNTASGRFNAFALLLSEDRASSLLPSGLLSGIQAGMRERELNLIVETFSDAALTAPDRVPRLLKQLSSDGLLINYNAHIPAAMVALIEQYRLPSIWLNSRHAQDCIYPDDRAAGETATTQLLDRGHRRVAFLDFITPNRPAEAHYSGLDRFAGYAAAMKRAGLRPLRIGDQGTFYRGGMIKTLIEVLRKDNRPTAVVCYRDAEARGVVLAATATGLRVPDDLSIITFGANVIEDVGPRASFMRLPQEAMGLRAVEMLQHRIDHPGDPLPPEPVPFTFELGQTLADVPSA